MLWSNIFIQAISIAISALLLLSNYLDKSARTKADVWMNAMLGLNAAKGLCYVLCYLLEGKAAYAPLNAVLSCFKCGLGFPMIMAFTAYIKCLVADKCRPPRFFSVACYGLCSALFLLNLVSIFLPLVFSCRGGVFARGPLYSANILLAVAALALDVAMVYSCRPYIDRALVRRLASYTVLPVLICAAQLLLPPDREVISIGLTLSLLVVYITLHVDRGRLIAQQEREMVEARVSVMLSQIQPHFMYNALLVIQDLCHDKAPEAEQAAVEFSRFLRGNIDSLKADRPIPFQKEVEHTRNYLALEKRRFGDRLNVEWDIRSTDFCIPALTLQPIAENAVRYGVTKRVQGGTVKISSHQEGGEFIITVADNGMGFDVDQPHGDGRTHIGIDNVRERLRAMCGGDLSIASTQGMGTIAVLTVPQQGGKV